MLGRFRSMAKRGRASTSGMAPAMLREEVALLEAVLRTSRRYLEFGSGGSTVLACGSVGEVTAVDSSAEWLGLVRDECAARNTAVAPKLVHADVGKVGDWGWPVDEGARPRWAGYHADAWGIVDDHRSLDVVLVDGRFRVACALQAALRVGATTRVVIHDYASRPQYHVVGEFLVEVARAKDLSVFVTDPGIDRNRAAEVLARHATEPG